MSFKIALIVLISITICKAYVSYENYKVYKIVPQNEEQVSKIDQLRDELHAFWTDVTKIGDVTRIMVSPSQNDEFVKYIKNAGMDPVLGVSNVQDLIRQQMQPAISRNVQYESLGSLNWIEFHTVEHIYSWLDELEDMYPGTVSVITIGKSLEGRDIKGVIIDFKGSGRGSAPLIGMIEGGIHSREWISPATVTWIIKEFLTSNNQDVRHMAEHFVWHIFPVVNPDGYAYTFSNDRMWRKNRNKAYNKTCSGGNDLSNGIDLNRNFNYLWMTIGASSDSCTQTYAGPHGASELETIAISNYVLGLSNAGKLIYYFAFHSFSQMTLVPFSHVYGESVLEVPNYGDLYEIAIRGAEKLEAAHGTKYTVGTSADILYPVSGSSFDWVKGHVKVPIVYLFELRDVGEYGFLLPTDQIIPNNEEIMACLIEMDRATHELGYYHSGSSLIYASLISLFVSAIFLLVVQ